MVGEARALALFFGPVAVDPAYRGQFLSLRITEAALDAGKAAGWPAAILICAHSLFGKAGFVVAPKHRLIFPGPQDQGRVMVRDLAGDAAQLEGPVTAP